MSQTAPGSSVQRMICIVAASLVSGISSSQNMYQKLEDTKVTSMLFKTLRSLWEPTPPPFLIPCLSLQRYYPKLLHKLHWSDGSARHHTCPEALPSNICPVSRQKMPKESAQRAPLEKEWDEIRPENESRPRYQDKLLMESSKLS